MFGLIVDGVLDAEEIVVKPLTARLKGAGVYAGATLLGDGRVSLILDVQAIARQWLTGQSIEAGLEGADAPSLPLEAAAQVLLVGTGEERRVAIPLAAVTRLEHLPRDDVEQAGGREVIQYRGAIVPLVRLGRLLGGREDPAGGDLEGRELIVVISTRGARTVAIAVDEVLDIVDDDPARHSEIADRGIAGSTVLGDRVTELLDVRKVVLSGDPLFFDDNDALVDPSSPDAAREEPDAASAALGSSGGKR
jgi:two-component system chemotaxis sensor kinase CheA